MKLMGIDKSEEPLEFSQKPNGEKQPGKRLSDQAGFTLVELIMVAAIIGVLASLAIPAYTTMVHKVKVARAISEIRSLEKSVLASAVDNQSYPNSLNDTGLGPMVDPWGNPYQYLNLANPGAPKHDIVFQNLNQDFDLFCLGPDGLTAQDITAANSQDDIVRAGDGGWVGIGEEYH